MRIDALAEEYDRSAALLRGRIAELERARRQAGAEEALALADRLRPLQAMYRETRAAARYLARYRDRRYLRRLGAEEQTGGTVE